MLAPNVEINSFNFPSSSGCFEVTNRAVLIACMQTLEEHKLN